MQSNSLLPLLRTLSTVALCTCIAAVAEVSAADSYTVSGTNIMKNAKMWVGAGCDDFEQTGVNTVTGYGIQIVRIPVDDMTECPIY
ncbi:MAG TPA: hypothetical protein VGH90_06540, partial [Chthoniobacteraceae bacterium]